MNPGGGNNPCGAKEQDRDESGQGKVIPVEQKSKIEMHPTGGSNPCGAKEEDRDASGRQKSSLWCRKARQIILRDLTFVASRIRHYTMFDPTIVRWFTTYKRRLPMNIINTDDHCENQKDKEIEIAAEWPCSQSGWFLSYPNRQAG